MHGTGNITELNRELEGYRYRNVRFTGEHYASRREDNTVVNAQAEPVGRTALPTDEWPNTLSAPQPMHRYRIVDLSRTSLMPFPAKRPPDSGAVRPRRRTGVTPHRLRTAAACRLLRVGDPVLLAPLDPGPVGAQTMHTAPDLLLRRRPATGMIRRWHPA